MDKSLIAELKVQLNSAFQRKKKIEGEIKELQDALLKELCPRGKDVCELIDCSYWCLNSCPFVNMIREEF